MLSTVATKQIKKKAWRSNSTRTASLPPRKNGFRARLTQSHIKIYLQGSETPTILYQTNPSFWSRVLRASASARPSRVVAARARALLAPRERAKGDDVPHSPWPPEVRKILVQLRAAGHQSNDEGPFQSSSRRASNEAVQGSQGYNERRLMGHNQRGVQMVMRQAPGGPATHCTSSNRMATIQFSCGLWVTQQWI